jgi:hypothetical protein
MIQYKEPSTDTRVNCSEVKDSRANLYLMKQQILEASIGGHEQEREGERGPNSTGAQIGFITKLRMDYLMNFCTRFTI